MINQFLIRAIFFILENKMGFCLSKNIVKNDNENSLILTPYEIDTIRNSWKLIAIDDGFTRYGSNMMIRYAKLIHPDNLFSIFRLLNLNT